MDRRISLVFPLWASFILVALAQNLVILESPNITNFGYWGEFETCPEGSLITAFQLKVEPKNSLIDDSGLNGIRLFCGKPPKSQPSESNEDNEAVQVPSSTIWTNLTSSVGIFGYWGKIFNCSTYGIGFDLEVVPPQGKYKDDKGATNMKLLCADGMEIEGYHNNGNGHLFAGAEYSGARKCPTGQGICGLQTQVEEYQTVGDDTALNNVRVKCCSLLDLIQAGR